MALKPCAGGASAPGKLMLAGEYAVLEGGVALVAAVSVRARVFWSPPLPDGSGSAPGGSPRTAALPPEALLTRRCAEALVGTVPCAMNIDVSELRQGGRKLGLGSSAAAASATAGAVLAWHGHDLSRDDVRREALALALEGHRAVAPEGSGADVAASVLGGVIKYHIGDVAGAGPVALPDSIVTRIVWTGVEARTSAMVSGVKLLRASDARAYHERIETIAAAAARMVAASEQNDAFSLISAVRDHADAMAALGEAASVPIVEDRLRLVTELAASAGGAAKPSGAGGGDVAVAFFARPESADAFEQDCAAAGLDLVCVDLGAPGVGEYLER